MGTGTEIAQALLATGLLISVMVGFAFVMAFLADKFSGGSK
jgi:hypothetical protein